MHKHLTPFPVLTAGLLLAVLASGCSSISRDTAIGAGLGGVTGAVVTGGSATGAAVGAVVGGVIGNEVEKKKK